MALYFKKYIFLKTLVYTIIYLYTHIYFNNFLFVFSTIHDEKITKESITHRYGEPDIQTNEV